MAGNDNVAVLKETSTTVSNDKTTFKIGAKASNNKTSGTYENRINFIVTGNPKPPLYMQDINNWRDLLVNIGDELVVADKRDKKTYTVAKQADDNIWMTQNLDFEITGEALTSDTTDLIAYGAHTGYETSAGYTKSGNTITWVPAATAITSGRTVPVSTSTGTVSGLAGWTDNNYAPYSAEGGDVYVYTSNSTSADTIYTSLSSCIAASHTETECKHYHRGNYYNWNAAVAHNNTRNVTELGAQYNTAANSICPAGWRLPVGAKNDVYSQGNTEFAYLLKQSNIITDYPNSIGTGSKVNYSTNGFNNLRSSPMFFTRGGGIYGSSLESSGTSSYYWSSSVVSTFSNYRLSITSYDIYPTYSFSRSYGGSVRCVARDPIYYMQDVAKWENKIPNIGDEITVVDKRDNKEYTVARQADGKIWMTQNLDFEITGELLTSETSDLIAYGDDTSYTSTAGYSKSGDTITWAPASTAITSNVSIPVSTSTGTISGVTGWVDSSYVPYSAEGGDVYVYTSNSTADDIVYTSLSSCIAASHTEAECKHYHRGNYYNWSAAVASNNTNITELNTQYNTAKNSICPSGWTLPVSQSSDTRDATTMQFGNLINKSGIGSFTNTSYFTGGFKKIRSSPLFFVRSGYIKSDSSSLFAFGSSGGYWSSSAYNEAYAYTMYFFSNTVGSAFANHRRLGYNVRCIARDPIY